MIQWLLLASCALLAAQGQLPWCSDDSHCNDGSFCLTEAHYCRECLHCDALHRQLPAGNAACIRFVSECGPCLKGYVDDRLGMGSGCTEPEGSAGVAWYVWVLGALLVAALLVCAAAVVVYALRNTDSFGVLAASTHTSVQAPAVGKPVAPTAPQPPPYNPAEYEPVRTRSPDPDPSATHYGAGDYSYHPNSNSDSVQPLVKQLSGPRSKDAAARESANSQNARVYNNPSYVRNVPPPSYDSALSDGEQEGGFVVHDEDTMPSDWAPAPAHHSDSQTIWGPFVPPADEDTMLGDWTPNTRNENDNNDNEEASGVASGGEAGAGAGGGGGGAGGGGALVAARRPSRAESASPPPNKIRCVEDSNNNEEAGGSDQSPSPSRGAGGANPPPSTAATPAPAPAAPAVVINLFNINSLHQRNDLSL